MRVLDSGKDGRPVWLGAATFDRSVGVSRYTGQITHHIRADIDAERDGLLADLSRAGRLVQVFHVSGIGPTLWGRNGGGDPFHTDGDVLVGVITPGAGSIGSEPQLLPVPRTLTMKNLVWARVKRLASSAGLHPD